MMGTRTFELFEEELDHFLLILPEYGNTAKYLRVDFGSTVFKLRN